LELLLLKDHQVIEAFLSDAPHEAFADGIGSWGMIRRFQYLDAAGCGHARERGPQFALGSTHELVRRLPRGGCFSQLLRHPSIGRRARHAHMDHPSRFQFYEEEGKERPKEKVSHRKARHRPRYAPRDCGGTCTTVDLVASGGIASSCTSQWFAYPRVSPISIVLRACAQLPRADCSSPSRLLKAIVSAATFGWWEEAFALRFHYRRKSSRCQRSRVSGSTMMRACFHVPTSRANQTRSTRPVLVRGGRFTCRLSMMRCCRRRAFSARSSDLLGPRSEKSGIRARGRLLTRSDCTPTLLCLQGG
jgi:hypothetical protein